MSETSEVKFVMKAETPWRVGYATRVDKLFIFKFDDDDIGWALLSLIHI